MRTKVLFSLCLFIASFTVSAQDTLRVNFMPAGALSEPGWDSLLVSDKTSFSGISSEYTAFGSTISVLPMWLAAPQDANHRSVSRDTARYQYYSGPMKALLSSYIAVDTRYDNNCNSLAITVTGLPEGTYTWRSYHHDLNDQYGTFLTSVSNNKGILDFNTEPTMISHSMDLETFNATYSAPDAPILEDDENSFIEHTVSASLDSITQFVFEEVVSAGPSDVIEVRLISELDPNPETSHSKKFVLINGFEIYETASTDVNSQQQESIQISNKQHSISISGKQLSEVSIYSIDGKLIDHVVFSSDYVEIFNLNKGIFIAKIGMSNGNVESKKIIIP